MDDKHSYKNTTNNKFYRGDNLNVLKGLDSESVDLIYLDPPFNTGKEWSLNGYSFDDRFIDKEIDVSELDDDYKYIFRTASITHSKPMSAYICYMTQRFIELHRVLRETGSFYLHVDSTAPHYLKIVLDRIFGKNNFMNEIIWNRNFGCKPGKVFGRNTDTVLFYVKNTRRFSFNKQYKPYDPEYIKKTYRHKDERGVYRHNVLCAPGRNKNDKEWRGYNPANIDRNWSVPHKNLKRLIKDEIVTEEKLKEMTTNEKLELLYQNGHIVFNKNGTPRRKQYLADMEGRIVDNLWIDVANLKGSSKEKTGYPTQKPLKLLHRIISASSNEGDIVLDPFAGCATTCVAAQQLNRKWIGIEKNNVLDLLKERLDNNTPFDYIEI